jgi:superfamily II DNA or RNA helicase
MFDEEGPAIPRVSLRPMQAEWIAAVKADRARFNRVLVVAPGGVGKSRLAAALAYDEWHERGGRTLVLENRDRLCEQIAEEIRAATGMDVDVEKGASRASPYAPIVVGSVQTLSRLNRLTAFSATHFSLVIVDEAHVNSLAESPQRVLRYFHWGSASLAEDWKPDDALPVHSYIVGKTATPDIGDRRSLGEFYQNLSVNYSFRQAVQDGWLVGPRAYREPLPSAKKLRARYGNTPLGKDLRADDLSKELIPLVSEMADQIARHAQGCKTIAFTPSVECARLLASACAQRGFASWFVSGECLDKDEKTDAFERGGVNSVLTCCALYVAGYDHPPIDCVAWFRPTTSRAFLIQGLYRGSRILKGVIDGCETAEQRRAAIAASAKPVFKIIDPLWRSEEIPLCSFYDLYSSVPEVKEKLASLPEGADLGAEAEKKERDWAASLAKAAKKQKERQAQIGVDPLAWATSVGEDRIANYVPQTARDAGPVAPEQQEFFAKVGIKYGHIKCYGQAQELISTYLARKNEGLASPKTIRQLVLRLGWPEAEAAAMSQKKAGALMAKGVRYRKPAVVDEDDPALAWGEG